LSTKTFYSNGKLLISGEYVVLDGAVSFAIPTKLGQSLTVEPMASSKLDWTSYDESGQIWYENKFSIKDLYKEISIETDEITKRLIQIIQTARTLNPSFLSVTSGFKITTHLDFKKEWGLGTSSTLINNMAQWANIDAFKLLKMTFGGSGYDIACAQHNIPVSYQLHNGKPLVKEVSFNPSFKQQLYFVYLNKKQNSREGIAQYKLSKPNELLIDAISKISHKIIHSKSLLEFESLITLHEDYISQIIKQKPIKELLFNDFKGCIKSLGAWGGDFILVTSLEDPSVYFKNKGFNTIIPFSNLIL